MSGIAQVLLDMGHAVSGSDTGASPVLDRLVRSGAVAWTGHRPEALPEDLDALVASTAVPADDPEVRAARLRDVPVLRRADALASIAGTRRTAAIAGTHGKTTTSTLTALVLEAGGVRPSWIIGGEVLGRGGGAHWDAGPWFVVEADESDGTFVELGAEAVVVTNVEPDHLEFYGSLDDRPGAIAALHRAFDRFVAGATGPRVLCLDDEGAAALAGRHDGVVTYGTSPGADYRIVDVELGRFASTFGLAHGTERAVVRLPTAGIHNVRNATAALAMGAELGVPLAVGAAGLEAYQGVGRRFHRRGERDGITFVDEYAHLPGEVRAALAAAKAGGWDRVVAVFQPHRYSRTAQVGDDFTGAFDDADLVVLTDVYGAGEPPRPGVDGGVVRRAVERGAGHPEIHYVAERATLAEAVASVLRPGDLCLTLGAGDVTRLADEILELP